jgi:capsular polysaccharide export protein
MNHQAPQRLLVNTMGLYRLRRELADLTALPVRLLSSVAALRPSDAIACWGVRPSQARVRRRAGRVGCPVWQFEDGFLRSIRPGRESPLSLVFDRTGIYYDARRSSDLETRFLEAKIDERDRQQAKCAIAVLRRLRLSKYNCGSGAPAPVAGLTSRDAGERLVVVVDQAHGDASIAGALAHDHSFDAMLAAAVAENPDATILVKAHPEKLSRRRPGYFDAVGSEGRIIVSHDRLNPWDLLERQPSVYTVSSLLGFEALMAGCRVSCFGAPFYAGWGLTDDRVEIPRRTRKLTLSELVHKTYLDYARYFDPWNRRPTDFFTAAEHLAFLRDHNARWSYPVVVCGIARWKRPVISAALTGSAGSPVYRNSVKGALKEARKRNAKLAAWGKRARTVEAAAEAEGVKLIKLEDGFLRSVGLGAGFVPPGSLAIDDLAHHFDGSRPSRLEEILSNTPFEDQLLSRAAAVCQMIVSHSLTKYNLRTEALHPAWRTNGRRRVLVPGQVADDESVRLGIPELFDAEPISKGGANLALLKRVRARLPSAFIIYRPHPDVSRGLRNGRIPEKELTGLCDAVAAEHSITSLFTAVDGIETMTSLVGFEALIRGLPVTVHGRPFYAGWGLTEDLSQLSRRNRRLSIEELVAGALLIYPSYVHAGSGRPCPAEIAIQELVSRQRAPQGFWRDIKHTLLVTVGRLRHQFLE